MRLEAPLAYARKRSKKQLKQVMRDNSGASQSEVESTTLSIRCRELIWLDLWRKKRRHNRTYFLFAIVVRSSEARGMKATAR